MGGIWDLIAPVPVYYFFVALNWVLISWTCKHGVSCSGGENICYYQCLFSSPEPKAQR